MDKFGPDRTLPGIRVLTFLKKPIVQLFLRRQHATTVNPAHGQAGVYDPTPYGFWRHAKILSDLLEPTQIVLHHVLRVDYAGVQAEFVIPSQPDPYECQALRPRYLGGVAKLRNGPTVEIVSYDQGLLDLRDLAKLMAGLFPCMQFAGRRAPGELKSNADSLPCEPALFPPHCNLRIARAEVCLPRPKIPFAQELYCTRRHIKPLWLYAFAR